MAAIVDDRTLQPYLDSLPPHEALAVKKRLDELRRDCGCAVGSIVMLGVTIGWIVHAVLVPAEGRPWQRTIATGFAVLVASALIGKLLGLGLARVRLYLELRGLRVRAGRG